MIEEKQLQEWERLANEATEGPWYVAEGSIINDDFPIHKPALAHYTCQDDAAFIAAAREVVPQLIAEVREMEADLQYADHFRTDCIKACEQVAQLEKEADWLAGYHGVRCVQTIIPSTSCSDDKVCSQCWREAARKAVESE